LVLNPDCLRGALERAPDGLSPKASMAMNSAMVKPIPPKKQQIFHASFSYQAQSWTKPRRVVAKVEWHQSELYPRVGFIVTT
jgi:Transposase DDE domain group 1